jgi:hypothetical protein
MGKTLELAPPEHSLRARGESRPSTKLADLEGHKRVKFERTMRRDRSARNWCRRQLSEKDEEHRGAVFSRCGSSPPGPASIHRDGLEPLLVVILGRDSGNSLSGCPSLDRGRSASAIAVPATLSRRLPPFVCELGHSPTVPDAQVSKPGRETCTPRTRTKRVRNR